MTDQSPRPHDGEWAYRCPGCQTEYDEDLRQRVDVDKIHENINTEGTAETLAKIHEAKTGHSTEVYHMESEE